MILRVDYKMSSDDEGEGQRNVDGNFNGLFGFIQRGVFWKNY